jgi:hypothetical protein
MGASGNDMGSRERDSEMRGTVLVADRGRCHAVRQSCPEVGRLTPTEWNIRWVVRREGWRDAEQRRVVDHQLSC